MEADTDVLVDFNNVTFSYDDDKNVVENLSFSIKKASMLLCQEEQVQERVQYLNSFLDFTSQIMEAY